MQPPWVRYKMWGREQGRAGQGRAGQGLWGRSGLSSAFHVSAAVVAIAERIFWRDAFGILTCRLCCASLLRMRSLSKCCQLCVSLRSASLARCLIAHTPCGLATKKSKWTGNRVNTERRREETGWGCALINIDAALTMCSISGPLIKCD